jgi:hypothetical protein
MNATDVTTSFPLQITFRNVDTTPETELWIRMEAAKLETFYKRIMNCRVAVEKLGARKCGPYHVGIDLAVPGGEIVIEQDPAPGTRARQRGESAIRKNLETRNGHRDLHATIHGAFKTAGRRLQDYARRQRGDVKHRGS